MWIKSRDTNFGFFIEKLQKVFLFAWMEAGFMDQSIENVRKHDRNRKFRMLMNTKDDRPQENEVYEEDPPPKKTKIDRSGIKAEPNIFGWKGRASERKEHLKDKDRK